MIRRSFHDYLNEHNLHAEIKLDTQSPYKPFVVDPDTHKNLRPLVQAFQDATKVPLPGPSGHPLTTLDKQGESVPKLKKKQLYLTGGAVRDHLLNKTPHNYELTTDATPDEIRLILTYAGFHEIKPDTKPLTTKGKVFFVQDKDKKGKEYAVTARVQGENYPIATLTKNHKGGIPDKAEFTPNIEEDAAKRDFTVNAMSIPLTNADGPNAKLIDPHGGAHHLKNGEIHFVGDAKERLAEDPLRALRYIRLAARIGKSEIPEKYEKAIRDVKDLENVSSEAIRVEFLKGLEHPDTDVQKYIKLYQKLGLLGRIFPNLVLNKDVSDKKDRRLQIAWLLKQNAPEEVAGTLEKASYPKNEINDIVHLLDLHGWAGKFGKDDSFFDDFYDKKNKHQRTSLVPSTIRQWGQMNGHDEDMLHHFTNHEMSTPGYVSFGLSKVVNPELVKLYGRNPEGKEFADGIKHLENEKFYQKVAQ